MLMLIALLALLLAIKTQSKRIALFSLWSLNQSEAVKKNRNFC